MKFITKVFAGIVAAAFLAGCGGGEPFYLGGIQVNEADQDRWVANLESAGMNTVSVTVYARQPEWDSRWLWFSEDDPGPIAEIRAAKNRGLNVVLVLRVALDHSYDRNEFLWHGMIMPATDDDVRGWFRAYRQFAGHWATIADREGIEVIAIGSEMNMISETVPMDTMPELIVWYTDSLKQNIENAAFASFGDVIEEKHLWVRGRDNYGTLEEFLAARTAACRAWAEQVSFSGTPDPIPAINARRSLLDEEWRSVIDEVRNRYRGRITYAANFDSYDRTSFWDDLDLIGINAYFPLRSELDGEGDGLEERFIDRWRELFAEVDSVRARLDCDGKQVLFTELGYTYRKNSTITPWNGAGLSLVGERPQTRELVIWEEQPVDYAERATAIRALHAVHRERDGDLLAGILYWKLSSHDYHIPVEPFVIHVGAGSKDPMLGELQRFVGMEPTGGSGLRHAPGDLQ